MTFSHHKLHLSLAAGIRDNFISIGRDEENWEYGAILIFDMADTHFVKELLILKFRLHKQNK